MGNYEFRPLPMGRRITNAVCAALVGFATGFLMGLSISPTAKLVLQSVLAVIIPAVAAIAGIQFSEVKGSTEGEGTPPDLSVLSMVSRLHIDLVPIAALCLFLAIGSSVGVITRTNVLLGPSTTIQNWRSRDRANTQFNYVASSMEGTQQLNPPVTQRSKATSTPEQVINPQPCSQPGAKTRDAVRDDRSTDAKLPVLFDSQAPPNRCAEMRNDPLEKRKQDLQSLSHEYAQRLYLSILACKARDCFSLAEEAICPSTNKH